MEVSLTQTVGSWTASSIKQIPTRTARGAINKAPVQLRLNGARAGVFAAKLRKSSPIKAGVFAAQFQLEEDDTPCVVTESGSCIDFGRYDEFSVKDRATPAELTHVFKHPRDISSVYEMGQVLGKGSFGVVRLGRDRANKQLRAVKSLPKLPPQASRQADGEASLSTYLSKLDDEVDAVQLTEGISQSVQYYGSYEDATHLHIVMEVCRGGSLQDRLTREGVMSEKEAAVAIVTCLQFLEKCHDRGLVYRDIKPENFMYMNTRKASGSFLDNNRMKAVDFGQCTRLSSSCEVLNKRSGTPAYMAPEVIKQCYDAKADMWCAGVMMYQLLSNRLPFWVNVHEHSLKEVWRAILVAEPDLTDSLWSSVSDEGQDVMLKMLDKDPRHRPTASQLLEHPWFRSQLGDDLDLLLSRPVRNFAREKQAAAVEQLYPCLV
mmetsp:Transcript_30167/g.50752  ORF Transcript_30167/g.50752 Transcript_30167/m.50752 type:complete len:433 (-) Transcript_30167:824-2122(-)|eukprot:CAMPEP_0198212726 /NCGR_PEP_ID=MMETSP1445-20131203/27354_1 /TAXON_ID=36898 /ORGANISM="Pyramimonas sp., Strain CCMP2087" /LENGTH=432 /DNA_ID=CAMNT_0043887251 /DNA_START=197 /DNA_END=1495 /DNA_ORIENTATION=-